MKYANGKYFRAVVASDDLSTAVELTLLDADGGTITLAAGERVHITDLIINNGGTARLITLFQDHDAGNDLDSPGEILYAAALAANAQNAAQFTTPIRSRRINAALTNGIHVIAAGASAGTRIVVQGEILSS